MVRIDTGASSPATSRPACKFFAHQIAVVGGGSMRCRDTLLGWPRASTIISSLPKIREFRKIREIRLQAFSRDKIPAGQSPRLVRDLSRPDYSIKDLLADIRHFKQQVAGAETTTERLIERWTLLDGIVEKCLAFTTFSHEDFFDTTEHAFCHHDSAGIILSANSKMLALDQHCLGKELPRYFGAMEAEFARSSRPTRVAL